MLPSALSRSDWFRSVHVGRSRFSRCCHLFGALWFCFSESGTWDNSELDALRNRVNEIGVGIAISRDPLLGPGRALISASGSYRSSGGSGTETILSAPLSPRLQMCTAHPDLLTLDGRNDCGWMVGKPYLRVTSGLPVRSA